MNWIEAAVDVLYSLTFNILIPREPRLKLCVLRLRHRISPFKLKNKTRKHNSYTSARHILIIMDTVISKDGTPIAYQRSGRGSALILIHGTTSDHSTTWKFILASLEEHFTSMRWIAEDVVRVVTALRIL